VKTNPAGKQDDAASDTDHFWENAFAQLKEPQELDSKVAALRKAEKAGQPKIAPIPGGRMGEDLCTSAGY
jgi:hypothetical protein